MHEPTLSGICSPGGSSLLKILALSLAKDRLKSKLLEPSCCHVFQPSCKPPANHLKCIKPITRGRLMVWDGEAGSGSDSIKLSPAASWPLCPDPAS